MEDRGDRKLVLGKDTTFDVRGRVRKQIIQTPTQLDKDSAPLRDNSVLTALFLNKKGLELSPLKG